jgi:ABC-type transport system involved in cytochrome c biogenesis permease subunit
MRGICLPAIVFLLGILPAASASLDFSTLENVPVQEAGRKKPFVVFAEEATQGLSGKTAVKLEDRKVGAMEFITGLWLAPDGWETLPVILVNNRPLKMDTGLDPQRKLFSYDELVANAGLRARLAEAAALRARPGNNRLTGLPKEAADVGMRLAAIESLASGDSFRLVPNPEVNDGPWSMVPPEKLAPAVAAFRAGNPDAFHDALENLRAELAVLHPEFQPPAWKINLEALYQKSHPIRWAWILYLFSGIAVALAGRTSIGYASAWALATAGFAMQVAGFVARILISGRAPVTNMYETVIWVAFGTVFFALVFEAIHRSRVFLLAAAPVAVASLILADSQPSALSRSISPLVPVLRDNFWLTTHVLTITMSYAAFALALAIGHIVLVQVIRGRKPQPALYNYLYRVLQVGVLLLAVGTILGGVWANYSWGRFWDWDPKEVWALVTLLAYLFVLHGRIAGKWGGFGMSVGAILCFQSVLMAWYGVNFILGVGLHSYGFGSGGFEGAVVFVVAEFAFVAFALWRKSHTRTGGQSPTVTGVPSLTRS